MFNIIFKNEKAKEEFKKFLSKCLHSNGYNNIDLANDLEHSTELSISTSFSAINSFIFSFNSLLYSPKDNINKVFNNLKSNFKCSTALLVADDIQDSIVYIDDFNHLFYDGNYLYHNGKIANKSFIESFSKADSICSTTEADLIITYC